MGVGEYLGLLVLAIGAGLSVFLLAEWWGRRRDGRRKPVEAPPAPSAAVVAHRATEEDWRLWAAQMRPGADLLQRKAADQ